MYKRPRLFDCDDFMPQLKIHVRDKDVDMGVMKEERMKLVYEKTLNLLNEGSKESNSNPNITRSFAEESRMLSNKDSRASKQLLLNNNMQLERSSQENEKTLKMDSCESCCQMICSFQSNRCFYCNKIVCNSCPVQCVKCHELFCLSCSSIMKNVEEENVCLSCYR